MMGLPNCREVAFQLSNEYARPQKSGRGLGMRLHLLICGACRRYQRYLAWMHRNMPRVLSEAPGANLSQAQYERIRQVLQEQMQ